VQTGLSIQALYRFQGSGGNGHTVLGKVSSFGKVKGQGETSILLHCVYTTRIGAWYSTYRFNQQEISPLAGKFCYNYYYILTT
jgi:hypothetical protein